MSRTDGHGPYWTWATWYEPVHGRGCPGYQSGPWSTTAPTRECDLPVRPVRHNCRLVFRRGGSTCIWEPVRPNWRQARQLYVKSVPKWYVDHVWNNAERARKRDGLRNLAKEYNAHGELADGDFPNWQHRHGATWYWD